MTSRHLNKDLGKTTKAKGEDREPATATRLRLKEPVDVEKIKELIGEIADKRFYRLKKKLIWDLDTAKFMTIDLGLYVRLGCWSHTSGSYVHAMKEVKTLCKAMFGYELPEKIGTVRLREYRYRTAGGLLKIAKAVTKFHEAKIAISQG